MLVLPEDLNKKPGFGEMAAFFHFSYVLLYFVGIMSMYLNEN